MINWKNNLQIYIDPSIKGKHKDLYSVFETEFSKNSANLAHEITDIPITELPTIYIVDELSEQLNLASTKDIIVLIEEANLNMFTKETPDIPHFKLDPTNDIHSFIEDILFIIKHKINAMAYEKVSESSHRLKEVFTKKNLKELLNEEVLNNDLKEIELGLYQINDLEKIQNFIHEHDYLIKNGLKLCDLKELINQGNRQYLPLPISDKDYVFLSWEEKSPLYLVQFLYTLLRERFNNQLLLSDSQLTSIRWEKIFSLAQMAIAIFDKTGQLIIGNAEFSKLNISFSECREFKNKEQVSINDSLFRILRNKDDEHSYEFTFVPVDDFLVSGGSTSSSEELGIISSSIAHEINNPLAGILAAVDYILLDEMSEEIETELKEMKAGVLRCKQLVNTFLGFSKLNKNLEFKKSEDGVGISDSIEMAKELLRFRLIESNIQIRLDKIGKGSFEQQINPHVLTIILYLMLGDMVTNSSHQSLVAGESKKQIDLTLEEKNNQLIFHLRDNATISDLVFKSKLVKHLFEMTGIKCLYDEREVNFIFS